jgi:hypothetical protein
VARTESRRFRLLNAVLMPMTMKYFRFPVVDSGDGAPLRIESCVAFAEASSISKFDIVLSNVLTT